MDLAALARSCAQGRQTGLAHVAGARRPYPVRHAPDRSGALLLLVRADEPAQAALTPADGEDDVTVAVSLPAPDGVRLWLSGWSTPLTEPLVVRAAALAFADVNPVADLLDLDGAARLHRVEVAEVRLECPGGHMIEIDPEEYAAGLTSGGPQQER
jgi:hypothetical protein